MSDPTIITEDALEMESIDGDVILQMTGIDGDEYQATPIDQPGTGDYNNLYNKPKIEGVTLEGDKSFEELSLVAMTNLQIEEILSE